MSQTLFSFQATPHEAKKLSRLMRAATKKKEGAQEESNAYTATLFKRYGHEDPESYQITVISNGLVVVDDYPSFYEIAAAHRAAHP